MDERSALTATLLLIGFVPGVTLTVSVVEPPACTVFGLAEPVPVGFVGVGVGVAVGVGEGVGMGVGVAVVSGIARIEMLSTASACALVTVEPELTE
jgi:hypothetical protein